MRQQLNAKVLALLGHAANGGRAVMFCANRDTKNDAIKSLYDILSRIGAYLPERTSYNGSEMEFACGGIMRIINIQDGPKKTEGYHKETWNIEHDFYDHNTDD